MEVEERRQAGPTQVVGRDDDALAELDGYYRRAGDDGRLRVLVRAVGLHVRGIIGAVDVVSGLRDPSVSLSEQVRPGGRWAARTLPQA